MAVVTGSWVDITDAPLPAGVAPQLEFQPSKEAVTVQGQLISSRPEVAALASDGTFTVNLVPTVDVLDAGFHYWVRGFYLDPDAYGGTGMTRVDLFEMKLLVPETGGTVDELSAGTVASKGWTIVSLTEPPVVIVGAGWLDADPNGDPNLGTGIYYEGEA